MDFFLTIYASHQHSSTLLFRPGWISPFKDQFVALLCILYVECLRAINEYLLQQLVIGKKEYPELFSHCGLWCCIILFSSHFVSSFWKSIFATSRSLALCTESGCMAVPCLDYLPTSDPTPTLYTTGEKVSTSHRWPNSNDLWIGSYRESSLWVCGLLRLKYSLVSNSNEEAIVTTGVTSNL